MSMTPALCVEITSMDAYLSLFGANGRNLPMIENELDVELSVRGSELFITGEMDEAFSQEYVRDAAFFGKNKSILLLGHYGAEFAGMRLLAKDLNETAAPTVFLDGGEVYRFL